MYNHLQLARQTIYSLVIPTPFLVGPVNVYLIKGDSLILVDTGPKTKEAWDSLVFQLKEIGYRPDDIEQVILTHHHPDHVGLLDHFRGKQIVAHEKARPWITKDEKFLATVVEYFQTLYRQHGVDEAMIEKMKKSEERYLDFSCETDLTITVREGDRIDGLNGWKVIETPGHAQSHISLYCENSGVVIAGDHLIKNISSNAILERPYTDHEDRPKTLLQYRDSLRKLLQYNITTVLPGHGERIMDANELIEERLLQQEKRALSIKQLLEQKPMRTFDICKIVFEKIYEKQAVLTFSEILGHIDLLEEMNLIEEKTKDGFIYFQTK